ncbi:hypothetical protein DPMN_164459 [Dreissena polymorpha]|uniref:NTR domain-containing protein n=2 Tax=Dreissena polymorpha TaxID=45954 RepID=A0A9D4IVN1_DREPO|nr:hypothetical protein DPMN_164459 [Dreissena polymorpha]
MEGSDQCQCTQSCMKQVNQELFEMALKFVSEKDAAKRRKLPKPVDTLMDYACNFKKANFVVKVNVTDVSNNPKRDVIFAHAVILEALLQGRDALREGADMEFEWDVTCSHPELTLGKIYYIIGKDGTTFNVNGMTRVRYDLMGTALVIDPEFKPLLRVLMHSFVTELKINKGCLN